MRVTMESAQEGNVRDIPHRDSVRAADVPPPGNESAKLYRPWAKTRKNTEKKKRVEL